MLNLGVGRVALHLLGRELSQADRTMSHPVGGRGGVGGYWSGVSASRVMGSSRAGVGMWLVSE